jgi:hypothetical protein
MRIRRCPALSSPERAHSQGSELLAIDALCRSRASNAAAALTISLGRSRA